MIKNFRSWIFVLPATVWFSCSNDVNPPLITLIEPNEGDVITVGTTLHVEADFEDAGELNMFKTELEGLHSDKLNEAFMVYDTVLHVGELSGSIDSEHMHFVIPDTVLPGPYLFTIYAMDEEGNESLMTRNLVFENDLDTRKPDVTINSPVSMQQLTDSVTVNVTLSDLLSDNATQGQPHYLKIYLQGVSDPSFTFTLGTYTHQDNFGGYYNTATDVFDRTFFLPGIISPGNYYLYIKARDVYFNTEELQVEIAVQ